MPRAKQITHKGKQIFYMDFSGVKSTVEINAIIDESVKFIRSQPNSSILTLTNISDMHFSNEIKNLFQNFIAGNKPYVIAGAVTGMSGLQQIVYNGLMKITGRKIKSFPDLDTAKEWLISN